MEQQSNNNLDKLFQRAGEEYPLKINNKNWDAVSSRLTDSKPAISLQKNKKWQYSFLLLLLLAGAFISIRNLNKNSAASESKIAKQESAINNSNSADKKQLNHQPTTAQDLYAGSLEKKHSSPKTKNQLVKQENFYTELPVSTSVKINPLIIAQSPIAANAPVTAIIGHLNQQILKLNSEENHVQNAQSQPLKQTFDDAYSSSTEQPNYTTSAKKSIDVKLRQPLKGFYGSLYFAPGFSSVKFQKLSKPGYMVGVSLGYHLNDRLSAEIGLQRWRNDFYSSGKYFDRTISRLKPSYKVDELRGTNKLTEIPLGIRYKPLKDNNHFFIGAGTTAALITHSEKINYSVRKNGKEKSVSRGYSSLTATKFLSSVNLSAGYQTSFYNICDVKIEPFYQAPLTGIGVGNLHINTFGINIGIVKDLK